MQIMMLSNFGSKLVLIKPFFVVCNKFCEVNSLEDNLILYYCIKKLSYIVLYFVIVSIEK